LIAGIWKLRGIRKEVDRGGYSLYLGEENAKHILLNALKRKLERRTYIQ
jgi:hypothetical protein